MKRIINYGGYRYWYGTTSASNTSGVVLFNPIDIPVLLKTEPAKRDKSLEEAEELDNFLKDFRINTRI